MFEPGSRVLVWGRMTSDGRSVILAPGAELGAGALEIATDVPNFEQSEPPSLLMLFFASDEERAAYAGHVEDTMPLIETRDVPYGDS